MTSWLMLSSQDRAVWVRALARAIALCSWARHFTLTGLSQPRWRDNEVMPGVNPATD